MGKAHGPLASETWGSLGGHCCHHSHPDGGVAPVLGALAPPTPLPCSHPSQGRPPCNLGARHPQSRSHSLAVSQPRVSILEGAGEAFSIRPTHPHMHTPCTEKQGRAHWAMHLAGLLATFHITQPIMLLQIRERLGVSLGERPPTLVPVTHVMMCMNCGCDFSLTLRRHHCHACGKVSCSIWGECVHGGGVGEGHVPAQPGAQGYPAATASPRVRCVHTNPRGTDC